MQENLENIQEIRYEDFADLHEMVQWLANQKWFYSDVKGISEEWSEIEFQNLPILIQSWFSGGVNRARSLKAKDYIYEWLPFAGYTRLVRRGDKIQPPVKNENDEIFLIIDGMPLSKRDWLKATGEWREEKLTHPSYPIFQVK